MPEKKRYTFQCWQCHETYELTTEIVVGQVLTLACPFCGAEAVFDPAPYIHRETVIAYRGDADDAPEGQTLDLPEILPTAQPAKPQE